MFSDVFRNLVISDTFQHSFYSFEDVSNHYQTLPLECFDQGQKIVSWSPPPFIKTYIQYVFP